MCLTTQVSVYAVEKMEVTSFVAKNVQSFREIFILLDSNEKPIESLFKLSQVYNQISHVVGAVSNSIML